MRNDARPIGHDAPGSLVQDGDDPRQSVTHDRQSHVVNRGAEEDARRDDADAEPAMPANDSTLKTKI